MQNNNLYFQAQVIKDNFKDAIRFIRERPTQPLTSTIYGNC